ncbi:MAG: cyclic nucleotide-binding domain-containing protein, partial [Bacteroidota bacterium]
KESQGFLQETLAKGETLEGMDYFVIPTKGVLELSYQKHHKTEERGLETFEMLHPLKFVGQQLENLTLRSKAAYEILRISGPVFLRLLNYYDQLTFSLLKQQYGNSYYDYVRFLREQEVFQKMSSLQLLQMAKKIETRHYQAGDRVASYAGLDEMDVYFVQSGKIALHINRAQIKGFGVKEVLHHHLAIPLRQVSIKVIASEDCSLYVIRRADMDVFSEKYPLAWKSIQPDYFLDPEFYGKDGDNGSDFLSI